MDSKPIDVVLFTKGLGFVAIDREPRANRKTGPFDVHHLRLPHEPDELENFEIHLFDIFVFEIYIDVFASNSQKITMKENNRKKKTEYFVIHIT